MRRHAIVLLLTLALVVRGLIPAGYMLAPSASGEALSVVICTGHGPETISLDPDGKPLKPVPARGDSGQCAYAGSVPTAPAVATVDAVEVLLTAGVIAFPPSADLVRAEHRGGGASARGPPLST